VLLSSAMIGDVQKIMMEWAFRLATWPICERCDILTAWHALVPLIYLQIQDTSAAPPPQTHAHFNDSKQGCPEQYNCACIPQAGRDLLCAAHNMHTHP
jgi:hypothetical protein